MARRPREPRNHAEIRPRVAYLPVIRRLSLDAPDDAPFMTFLSTAQQFARGSRERSRGHLVPITIGGAVGISALALVAYLLWPTWGSGSDASNGPARLPVSIGATLFNVPAPPIRLNIPPHPAPQQPPHPSFLHPSLPP